MLLNQKKVFDNFYMILVLMKLRHLISSAIITYYFLALPSDIGPTALNGQDLCAFVWGTVLVNLHFCSVLERKSSLWKGESKPSKTAAETIHEIFYLEHFCSQFSSCI